MPTCVGFGTGRCRIITRSFSWKLVSSPSLLAEAFAPHHIFALNGGFAYRPAPMLVPQSVKRGRLTFSVTPSFLRGYRNINLLSIDYALQPRLRSRLTQGGRTFPWNPWAIGVQDSHLHLATHTGILTSMRSTAPSGTASPPMERSPTSCSFKQMRSFGNMLSPGTFSAQGHSTSELLRTLSRMAASEPTS